MAEFEKEMKGEGLDDDKISQCRDIIRGIYIGQNIRGDGILESYVQIFGHKPIGLLLKYNYIKRFQWYHHILYRTTEKGSKIGKSEVTNLITEKEKMIVDFLNAQPQKVLNFVIQEHYLENEYEKFIYPVSANDISASHLKGRLRKNDRIHDVWTSILSTLENLGLCIRTHYYVSNDRKPRKEYYVISPEVFTFLVKHCRKEALSLSDKDYEKAELYEVLSQYTRDCLWEKLIDTKHKLEEEKVKTVVDKRAKEGITSEYKGFQSPEAPFSIKDKYRYEEWLEKNLWEPVVEFLLDSSGNGGNGSPKLKVSLNSYAFGDVEQGTKPFKNFTVENVGEGTLNWEVRNYPEWLEVSPTKGTNDGSFAVAVKSNASVGEYDGTVEVISNGGNVSIGVSCNIPKIGVDPYLKETIVLGTDIPSRQYGIIGKISGKKVAIDLNEPHTISIFGIQGSGKSYTLGVITEMAVQGVLNISTLDKPLASVIFHYSKKETYTPEFESFTRPNKNQEDINELQALYKAEPMAIKDIKILVPPAKLGIRKEQYENLMVEPLLFRPQELGAPEWSLLLGAGGEQLYLKKIKNILEKLRMEGKLTVDQLKSEIQTSELTKNQKGLSILRVGFVEKFLNENAKPFEEYLTPGTITLLDIRDDMLDERDASILLGMLLISMGKIERDKLLVIDEAHKYFGKTLAKDIVELIREMRHTRTRILIASQDPPSVNARVIELSDVVILHRMNSPEWLKHIQGKNIALKRLKPEDLSSLKSGEAYIWASKSTEQEITKQPMKIEIRPRITEHGGATKTAV